MNRLYRFCGLVLLVPLLVAFDVSSSNARDPYSAPAYMPLGIGQLARLSPEESLRALISHGVISPKGDSSREFYCLAQAVYFEARSEPLEGQVAVAQVVLNRVDDRRYPGTICEVVFQNESRLHRCQFSFACDGISDTPFEARSWETAKRISRLVLTGRWPDLSANATHYHANYVDPFWRYSMARTAEYGRHAFYRESGK